MRQIFRSADSTSQTRARISQTAQVSNGLATLSGTSYLCRPLPLRISCFALPTPNLGSSGLRARTMT